MKGEMFDEEAQKNSPGVDRLEQKLLSQAIVALYCCLESFEAAAN